MAIKSSGFLGLLCVKTKLQAPVHRLPVINNKELMTRVLGQLVELSNAESHCRRLSFIVADQSKRTRYDERYVSNTSFSLMGFDAIVPSIV